MVEKFTSYREREDIVTEIGNNWDQFILFVNQ